MEDYKKIKTFEAACKILKIDPKKLPDVKGISKAHQAAIIAYYKLRIIAQAINDNWKPNWKDYSQYKYYPWFEQNKSGLGFSYAAYAYWRTYSTVGSRLCYKDSDRAMYAGKQFKKLYNDILKY